MSEIKEGEYIRTSQGYIAKVEDIVENVIKVIMCDSNIYCDYEIAPVLVGEEQIKLITKHSFNIIDLIELGDYVNGHKVIEFFYGEDDNEMYMTLEAPFNERAIYVSEKDIKTIVTKEQFNSVMYKVGDIE